MVQLGPLAGSDKIGNVTVNVMGWRQARPVPKLLTQGSEAQFVIFTPVTTGGKFSIDLLGKSAPRSPYSTAATTAPT